MGGPSPPCPLCRSPETRPFVSVADPDITRDYHRCGRCALTFLDPAQRLSPEAEKSHYDHHENDPANPGYRRFLAKLADPLKARLTPGSSGLDYGCGPGPALAHMLREAGHRVALYDPFYVPDPAPLSSTYDFVTCTEVAEHFQEPAVEFERLAGMLKPGGILAVMTCFQTDDARFTRWHYRADPTHVCFYRCETFEVLAAQRGLDFESPAKDIALMRKSLRCESH